MIATIETQQTTTTQVPRATEYLEALGRRDFESLESLFAPNVWLRALLPRKVVETHHLTETLAALRGWFEGASDFRVLATVHHTIESREFISYRFLLRPDWAPDQWHVIEQSGYLRVREGRISRIDVVCTGFFPVEQNEIESYQS